MDTLEWLVNHGANINARDNNGYEPVHVAAEYGQVNVLDWLINNGAHINACQTNGHEPVHLQRNMTMLMYLSGL